MKEKDLAEKILENYNDIFADIMNVILFNGEMVVQEDALIDVNTESWFEDSAGVLRDQSRDTAKLWQKGNVQLALYGIENQTKIDKRMPLRVISYDGAAYKTQCVMQVKKPYPVVTIILYFGDKKWNKNKCLWECMEISEKLKPYVNDYQIHVCEVAYLTEEQIQMFQSDFRQVAEFFVNKRLDRNYVPTSKKEIRHVEEVLRLISAVTKDEAYIRIYKESEENGRINNMCEVAERLREQGRIEVARQLLDVLDIQTIAEKTGLSIEVIQGLKE